MSKSVKNYKAGDDGHLVFEFDDPVDHEEALLVPLCMKWDTFYGIVLLNTNDGMVYVYRKGNLNGGLTKEISVGEQDVGKIQYITVLLKKAAKFALPHAIPTPGII